MVDLDALEKGLSEEWKPAPGLQKAIDDTCAKIRASGRPGIKIKATLRAQIMGEKNG